MKKLLCSCPRLPRTDAGVPAGGCPCSGVALVQREGDGCGDQDIQGGTYDVSRDSIRWAPSEERARTRDGAKGSKELSCCGIPHRGVRRSRCFRGGRGDGRPRWGDGGGDWRRPAPRRPLLGPGRLRRWGVLQRGGGVPRRQVHFGQEHRLQGLLRHRDLRRGGRGMLALAAHLPGDRRLHRRRRSALRRRARVHRRPLRGGDRPLPAPPDRQPLPRGGRLWDRRVPRRGLGGPERVWHPARRGPLQGDRGVRRAGACTPLPVTCATDRDCTDHDLCDGVARCVGGRCLRGTRTTCAASPCHHAVCKERSLGDRYRVEVQTPGCP